MRHALRAAIVDKFDSQTRAAFELKIDPARLSRLIRGWFDPHEDEIKKLVQTFGKEKIKRLLKGGRPSASGHRSSVAERLELKEKELGAE